MSLIVAWLLESLSIPSGFPFGQFDYSDKLGEKIGAVPVMIFPAYFFNGYLAWTMAGIFCGHSGSGIDKKNLLSIPLVAASLMVAWNAVFDIGNDLLALQLGHRGQKGKQELVGWDGTRNTSFDEMDRDTAVDKEGSQGANIVHISAEPADGFNKYIIAAGYLVYRTKYKIDKEFYDQIVADLKERGDIK